MIIITIITSSRAAQVGPRKGVQLILLPRIEAARSSFRGMQNDLKCSDFVLSLFDRTKSYSYYVYSY